MVEIFVQVMIAVLSAAAIWMISRPEDWAKWGFVIGLASEPFWFYSVITNGQWGIFALSVFYTYSFCQGIYFRWVKGSDKIVPRR